MNKRRIINSLGKIILTEVLLMIPSLIVALIYGDGDWKYFIATMIPAGIIGFLFTKVKAPEKAMRSRDGYCIVALAWIIISSIGAFPLYFSGAFETYWGALFEIVSGFTTTGASVLAKPEVLPHGVLFWRSFSHWVGGMGVLVFVMMIMPMENENSMHLVKAEVPGPVAGKLVPRMKKTSRILYSMYAALTIVLVALLLFGGLDLYDSLCLAFGTAGTGGFALSSAGIAGYNSAYVEIVLAVFMILFGVNFNLYYLILMKRVKEVVTNEELWWYLGFIAFGTITICVNICNTVSNVGTALRQAFFQVSSIITTTGFATVDFDMWPEYSKHMLVLLMFVGACAGSTGGGMKVSRVIILVKSFFNEIKYIIDPRVVSKVRLNGKAVEKEVVTSTRIYTGAYFIIICVATLIISLDGFDFETNVTAVVSCFNNIGPGLASVGPMMSFGEYSPWVQAFLSLIMLTGRLEIFPMFMLFSKSAHDKI